MREKKEETGIMHTIIDARRSYRIRMIVRTKPAEIIIVTITSTGTGSVWGMIGRGAAGNCQWQLGWQGGRTRGTSSRLWGIHWALSQ